jgi:hypothetical protein
VTRSVRIVAADEILALGLEHLSLSVRAGADHLVLMALIAAHERSGAAAPNLEAARRILNILRLAESGGRIEIDNR